MSNPTDAALGAPGHDQNKRKRRRSNSHEATAADARVRQNGVHPLTNHDENAAASVDERVQQFLPQFLSHFSPSERAEAMKQAQDTVNRFVSSIPVDQSPALSSSVQTRRVSSDVSHPNSTRLTRQTASSSPHSGSAGPSRRVDTPKEIIVSDSSDEDSDDDLDLDEMPVNEKDEEELQKVVNVLTVKKEPKEEPDTNVPDLSGPNDKAETTEIAETQVRYCVKRNTFLLSAYPSALHRSIDFEWDKGPVVRKTIATTSGLRHLVYFVAIISAILYLVKKDERVSIRTCYYMVKKTFMQSAPKSKCRFSMFLQVLKEISLTCAVTRDNLGLDSESKGSVYGDFNIIVKNKSGTGTRVMKSKKRAPLLLPAASRMVRVELPTHTARILGAEAKGPFSRGTLLKRLLEEHTIVAISRGNADRNFLRFWSLASQAKMKMDKPIPMLWLGDANHSALWIHASGKRGNRGTVFENTKFTAPDTLYIGLNAEDVAKVERHQQIMTEQQRERIQSYINDEHVPREVVPVAEGIRDGGYYLEADTVEEEDLYKMIVHRGNELASAEIPPYPVVDRPLRPAFTRRDVESLPRLEFKEQPRTPHQPEGDTHYQLEVGGQKFTSREIIQHSDETLTVRTSHLQFRRLSREDIGRLMDPEATSLFTLYYEHISVMAEDSPNPDFREGLIHDTNVLRESAVALFPGEVPSEGPLPPALMAKVHWLLHCLLSLRYKDAHPNEANHYICLACGRAHSQAYLLWAHLTENLVCARTAAKFRLEGVVEPEPSNTDPHWCRIGGCQKRPPDSSQVEYEAHWLTHRVHCDTCSDHFANEKARETHKQSCPQEDTPKSTFKTPSKSKAQVKCDGCGRKISVLDLDSHLSRNYGCALAYSTKRPQNGKSRQANNTNARWCHIGPCKTKAPVRSDDGYKSHWMDKHRIVCKKCGYDYPKIAGFHNCKGS
ncbi:Cyclin-dependent kinase 13 [Rhizoctonia solani]|uniref:Cyclin-dependent kinase 13 n=1 Tax=Rhizoctonia solani TaxID=456999 RepID=A0A0K6FQZ4_9AGAM|nr:Cyclin-dependent kinase 13 [Rhizoctonia solani]